MNCHNAFKLKRALSCVIGIMMLFIVLFSAFYVAHEINHDCTGDDCPVCACVVQCEKTLHQICEWIAPQIAIILQPVLILLSVCISMPVLVQDTLVSKKVRLDH